MDGDTDGVRCGVLSVAREGMRTLHMACWTEQAYLQWMRRYIFFHHRRHPGGLRAAEVEAFLTHLPVQRKASASAQNQVLRLRVKDLPVERQQLIVCDGKR
ncbi:MAG: phage integrase N-terminal SAM-like domain-containing protein [Chromatiales bacterium]|nr:phage integrase N-terminal SAM-like domain-containing protein [Chromatiales bacterium]